MATDLIKLKCGDCCKCDNMGWGQHFCDETGLPIGADQPACISILPKLSARDSSYFEISLTLQKQLSYGKR